MTTPHLDKSSSIFFLFLTTFSLSLSSDLSLECEIAVMLEQTICEILENSTFYLSFIHDISDNIDNEQCTGHSHAKYFCQLMPNIFIPNISDNIDNEQWGWAGLPPGHGRQDRREPPRHQSASAT